MASLNTAIKESNVEGLYANQSPAKIKEAIVKTLVNQDLPNIVFFKVRSEPDNKYTIISKSTGALYQCSMRSLVSKVEEELALMPEFKGLETHQLSVADKKQNGDMPKDGENLVADTLSYVDMYDYDPAAPFGKTRDYEEPAFTIFNTYKMSPKRREIVEKAERLLATKDDPNPELERVTEFDEEWFGDQLTVELKEQERGYIESAQSNHVILTDRQLLAKLKNGKDYPLFYLLLWNFVGGEKIDEEERDRRMIWLLHWFSHTCKIEHGKTRVYLLVRGRQGSGKTSPLQLLFDGGKEFGGIFKKFDTLSAGDLQSDFQDGLDTAEFVLADEVELNDQDNYKAYAKIKEYANDGMSINAKFKARKRTKIHFNFALTQNPVGDVKIDFEDRRFTMFITGNRRFDELAIEIFGEQFGFENGDDVYDYIKREERDNFLVDLHTMQYDKKISMKPLMTHEKMETTIKTNKSEDVLMNLLENRNFKTLYEDGFITPNDFKEGAMKELVMRLYIELEAGFMSSETKRLLHFVNKMHKKRKASIHFEDILEREALITCREIFTEGDNVRKNIPNSKNTKPTLFLCNKFEYNREKVIEAYDTINGGIEKIKAKFEEIVKSGN